MSPQCSYFQNYSDLLTLLQCQRVTNVTIAVQVHINLKNKKNNKKSFFFFLGAEIPRQIIVKSASDAEIPLPRKNRGSIYLILLRLWLVLIHVELRNCPVPGTKTFGPLPLCSVVRPI